MTLSATEEEVKKLQEQVSILRAACISIRDDLRSRAEHYEQPARIRVVACGTDIWMQLLNAIDSTNPLDRRGTHEHH